jgi:hypothetical protein
MRGSFGFKISRMEQSTQSKRPQKSPQEISQLLEEFKSCGLRTQEFCEYLYLQLDKK